MSIIVPDLALWFVEGGIVDVGGDFYEPSEHLWECAPVVAETRAKAKHLFLDHPNTYSLWLEWTDLRCRLLTRDIGAALREAGPQALGGDWSPIYHLGQSDRIEATIWAMREAMDRREAA